MKESNVQKNWNNYYGNPHSSGGNHKLPIGFLVVLIFIVALSVINRFRLLDMTANADITQSDEFVSRSILTYGYDYHRNGEGFHKDMVALEACRNNLDANLTADELLQSAEETRKIAVDKYYEAYKEAIASALETKASLIAADIDIFSLTEWQNNIKIAIFDAMEAAFIDAGIQYQRNDVLSISYQYKVIR